MNFDTLVFSFLVCSSNGGGCFRALYWFGRDRKRVLTKYSMHTVYYTADSGLFSALKLCVWLGSERTSEFFFGKNVLIGNILERNCIVWTVTISDRSYEASLPNRQFAKLFYKFWVAHQHTKQTPNIVQWTSCNLLAAWGKFCVVWIRMTHLITFGPTKVV